MDSHTLQSMFFSYFSCSFPSVTVLYTPPSLRVSVSLAHSPHDEWIKTKKRRQTTKRSVLADSSDLGIYGEALGSDIHPEYFMSTAHGPSKGTEIPRAQLNISMVTDILTKLCPKKNVELQHKKITNKCVYFTLFYKIKYI